MQTIRDSSKNWTKGQLREYLLNLIDDWMEFEKFLIKKLGEETYRNMCIEHAREKSCEMLRSLGLSDEHIEEFVKRYDK